MNSEADGNDMSRRWTWVGCIGFFATVILWWCSWSRVGKPVGDVEPHVGVGRCASCHEAEAKEFALTGHAQTLRRADDSAMRERFAGQTVRLGDPPREFRFVERDGRLFAENDQVPIPLPVDWIFGSGHHGMTPLSVRVSAAGETESLEHHATWYASSGLQLTIGHPPSSLGEGVFAFGLPRDPAFTRQCFGCHTTRLPIEKQRIRFDHLVAGVSCQRCHPGTDRHANEVEVGADRGFVSDWKTLSPLASVDRCGECHRRLSDVPAGELTVTNSQLARFASVGLVMSRCFEKQASTMTSTSQPARLDCLTCHDPHRPNSKDQDHFNDRCRDCHGSQSHGQTVCSKPESDGQCINCHMPKTRMKAPIQFTDHWIRVRRD